MKKANDLVITQQFLNSRVSAKFGKQKWISFCEKFVEDPRFKITLYEARKTFSKYITFHYKDKTYKVRFSNHKPMRRRENEGDCDFFVGVTHLNISTTDDAIKAVSKWAEHVC